MKCNKMANLISDYIDDCLPDAVRREFERHLDECSDCESKLIAMEQMVSNLSMLSGRKSPVDCWPAIHQCITKRESFGIIFKNRLMRPIVVAPALAALLAFGLFLLWPGIVSEPVNRSNAASQNQTVSLQEYGQYIGAHSQVQRHQAFSDPDVVFINAELETASLSRD